MCETISYADLCAKVGGEPYMPCAYEPVRKRVSLYFPDWAPPERWAAIQEWFVFDQGYDANDVHIIRVTDVPHDRLFRDWREAAPDAATGPGAAEE